MPSRSRDRHAAAAAPGRKPGHRLERTAETPAAQPGQTWRLVALFAAASVLTVAAALHFPKVWSRFAGPHFRSVSSAALNRAFNTALASLTPDAESGRALAIAGDGFTAGLRSPTQRARAEQLATALLTQQPRAGVARLQRLALQLQALDEQPGAAAQRGVLIRRELDVLEQSDFQHYLGAWLDTATGIYGRLGLGPGTSRRMAYYALGHPHSAYSQYLVDETARLARSGDSASAARCRQVLQRALQSWLLQPGPISLRLLAAELLLSLAESPANAVPAAQGGDAAQASQPASAAVEPRAPSSEQDSAPPADVMAAVRSWRAAARARLDQQNAPIPLFSPDQNPDLTAPAHRTLLWLTLVSTTLLAATAAAALVALAALAYAVLRRGTAAPQRRVTRVGLGLGAVLVALAAAWPIVSPYGALAELRFVDTPEAHYVRHPFVAAAVVLLALGALAGLLSAGHRGRRAGVVARLGVAVWVVLAAGALGASLTTSAARARYETAVANALTDSERQFPDSTSAAALTGAVSKWKP